MNKISWRKHPEYVQFMKEYIPGHTESEIRDAFDQKFHIVMNRAQIKNFKTRFDLRSGTMGGQFLKGQVSHNKGQKMSPDVYKRCAPTMFKKGQVPINHKEVGSERINVDGYTEVKVAEPNRWKLKHRMLYEHYTGEKLSSNDAVIFLDGNKQNFNIDNLFKLSRAALVRYNQDHIYNSDPNISLAAAQIATIKALKGQKINEK